MSESYKIYASRDYVDEKIDQISEEMAVFREITEFDNGKFLRVVDGEAKWAEVPNAEEASF